MIAYTTLGTNDIARAGRFYDELMAALGAQRVMDFGRMVIWGTAPNAPMFAVCTPYDGQKATVGNGTMVALAAPDRATVDRLYDKVISLGATCEGKPGVRAEQFYVAYFRDLDGNKLNFFAPA